MMIDNINANQMGQVLPKPPSPQPDSASARAQTDSDVALQVDFANLVDQAQKTTVADASDVQKARELLLSGELTSPENVKSAAQNMLRFGI